jgi:hypothetical protein
MVKPPLKRGLGSERLIKYESGNLSGATKIDTSSSRLFGKFNNKPRLPVAYCLLKRKFSNFLPVVRRPWSMVSRL